MEIPSAARRLPMGSPCVYIPCVVRGKPIGCPWGAGELHVGSSMGFAWGALTQRMGYTVGCPRVGLGFPVGCQRSGHGYPMGVSWVSHL